MAAAASYAIERSSSRWTDIMAAARAGKTLHYRAPMDVHAMRLTPGAHAFGYVVRARTLRIYPPGCFGRGRMRTHDPFTANIGHADRFVGVLDNPLSGLAIAAIAAAVVGVGVAVAVAVSSSAAPAPAPVKVAPPYTLVTGHSYVMTVACASPVSVPSVAPMSGLTENVTAAQLTPTSYRIAFDYVGPTGPSTFVAPAGCSESYQDLGPRAVFHATYQLTLPATGSPVDFTPDPSQPSPLSIEFVFAIGGAVLAATALSGNAVVNPDLTVNLPDTTTPSVVNVNWSPDGGTTQIWNTVNFNPPPAAARQHWKAVLSAPAGAEVLVLLYSSVRQDVATDYGTTPDAVTDGMIVSEVTGGAGGVLPVSMQILQPVRVWGSGDTIPAWPMAAALGIPQGDPGDSFLVNGILTADAAAGGGIVGLWIRIG